MWVRYLLLPDKTPLRIRVSAVSFDFEGGKAIADFSQMLKKTPTDEDKGTPSADQSISDRDVLKNIDFERVFESLNIYDVPKARKFVICKPMLKAFSMTNKFDSMGDRIYQCAFTFAVAPIDYPPEASELSPKPSKSPP